MKKISEIREVKKTSRSSKGFTLVEILIVLALIGIVAGLAMQNLEVCLEMEKKRLPKHGLTPRGLPMLTAT